MLKRVFATLALIALPLVASAADYVAGKDYTVLPAQGRLDKPGMIEVREFFWYGCPHCFKLEPYMAAWAKTKPANVNFVRTPAALNPQWEVNARGFYVAEMLGKLEQTHGPLFNAIHIGKQRPFDQTSLAKFYSAYGIDAKNFSGLYNSFAVSGKVNQSKNLAMGYRLDGVPAVVVNGKYVVKGEDQRVVNVVNYLIAKEQPAKPAAPAKK